MQPMRKLSRREFMTMLAAAGGGGLLAACGPRPTPQPEAAIAMPTLAVEPTVALEVKVQEEATAAPEAAAEAATAVPTEVAEITQGEYGGLFRASVQSDLPSLDPASCGWIDWWLAYACIYSRLYDFDEKGELILGVAADFPSVSADGLTYLVPIKEGVKFHDGTELTAEDAKFSLDRHYSSVVTAITCGRGHLKPIVGVTEVQEINPEPELVDLKGTTVLDPYTLQIEVTRPYSVLPFVLAIHAGNIAPKKALVEAKDTFGTEVMIGSGPFKVAEWRPGEAVMLERFDDYYKAGLPYLDNLEILLNLDYQASLLRFESRELEYLLGPQPEDAKRLLEDPVFKHDVLFGEYPGWISYIDFAVNVPPFDDIRARQAVAFAVDKVALNAASGGANLPWDQLFTPRILQYDPDFKTAYPHDPDKARALVELVSPGGIKGVKMWPGGIDINLAQIIQEDLKNVGIELEIVEGDQGVVIDRIKSGEIQMVAWGWANDYPDAMNLMVDRFYCDPNDTTRYARKGECDAQLNDWFIQIAAMKVQDPGRTRLLRQAQDWLVNETAVVVPIRHIRILDLVAQYLKDVRLGGTMMPWLETAWIDTAEAKSLQDIRPVSG